MRQTLFYAAKKRHHLNRVKPYRLHKKYDIFHDNVGKGDSLTLQCIITKFFHHHLLKNETFFHSGALAFGHCMYTTL